MPRRREKPPPENVQRRLVSVTELTDYLHVSKVHLYRILKNKGAEYGVYHLKGKSPKAADLIRIDLERFLHTQAQHFENTDALPPPLLDMVSPADLKERIKQWMGRIAPIRTHMNEVWDLLARFYDQLDSPEGSQDEQPAKNGGNGA